MARVPPRRLGQRRHALHVHGGEGGEGQFLQLFGDLGEALVPAGLEHGGGHGDGPDAAPEELVDIEEVRAAGVAQPEPPAEVRAQPPGHLHRQGEEALPGHVHLPAGELAVFHVHGEGVGELQAELQPPLPCQLLQAAEHGNRVGVLQVLPEVVLVEGHVAVAHAVQDGAGGLVAQEGGIALDESMQALLRQEVGGDALDLLRRTAVEGGEGDAAGDSGGDAMYERPLRREYPLQYLQALPENGRGGGVHHLVEIAVDLLPPDALQVVAHGHIEDKALRVPQAIDPGHDLTGAPGFHVLLECLLDSQLRGPLAVVALVLRQDAGTADAGGKLRAVHLLDGLELKEPGPGEVPGDDVLGHLGVGPRGGAEGGLQPLSEDGQVLLPRPAGAADAED